MKQYSLAVDIGGTFTDVVLLDTHSGAIATEKVLSTPRNPLVGLRGAVRGVLDRVGIAPHAVTNVFVHATTIVTNAIIERKGARTALLTTDGFGDVLRLRDEHRYDMYDLQLEYPAPLVPRELTFTVHERTRADGVVLRAVEPEELRTLAAALTAAHVEAVAVALLHSYRNPANEQAVAQGLATHAPQLLVSLSSEVIPQIGEYERTSTTVLNAYTQSIAGPYLRELADWLIEAGFPSRPLVMLSSGGVAAPAVAGRFPVRMIESGPAAGVLAATHFARTLDTARLLSFDMGGTTAKACLIEQYSPLISARFEVARVYRFKPGSGLPVAIPSVDLIEIGAGGGSIAGLDALGLLTVGPRSAGADPGPASYDHGGTEPTVTDADLLLGYLDAHTFLGGAMPLSVAAATQAFEPLAAALALSVPQSAAGVYDLVNEGMAAAIREHAIERGLDVRGLPLLAFGGAGPVHACHVAELIESPRVIFPRAASVLSAYGALLTPVRMDLVRSDISPIDQLDWERTEAAFAAMTSEAEQALAAAGVVADYIRWQASADMRYHGQQLEVNAPLPTHRVSATVLPALVAAFEREYEKIYGVRVNGVVPEVVNWRLTASAPESEPARERPETAMLEKPSPATAAPARERPLIFDGAIVPTPVYLRQRLKPGQRITGPAVIEERDTTIVLRPGWSAQVDAMGNVIAEREVRYGD